LRLERTHKDEGAALRVLWAQTLAKTGAYADAVDALWPVVAMRHLAAPWIESAVAVGGATGARALLKAVRIEPSRVAEVHKQLQALLHAGDNVERAESIARVCANELLTDVTPETQVLARSVALTLLRVPPDAETLNTARRLIKISGDAVLDADLKATNVVPTPRAFLAELPSPVELRRDSDDRGAFAVEDAAVLPDGRTLVALGERGVWLLSRDGKVETRFAEPATHIVLSDHGDRAILVVARGETRKLSRLDLVTRRLDGWCNARIDCFASSFDGATWFVSRGGSLYAIDANAPRFEHSWKVDEPDTVVGAIARDFKNVSIWLTRGETWTYELPSMTLRERRPVQTEGVAVHAAVSADGVLVQSRTVAAATTQTTIDGCGPRRALGVELGRALSTDINGSWLVSVVPHRNMARVHVLQLPNGQPRMHVVLEDAHGGAHVRIDGDRLTICDLCGRVLVVSLKTGAVLREHRAR
jgi:hypothetical protein